MPPKNTAARFSGGSFLGIICFLKLYYIFSKISLFYIKPSRVLHKRRGDLQCGQPRSGQCAGHRGHRGACGAGRCFGQLADSAHLPCIRAFTGGFIYHEHSVPCIPVRGRETPVSRVRPLIHLPAHCGQLYAVHAYPFGRHLEGPGHLRRSVGRRPSGRHSQCRKCGAV